MGERRHRILAAQQTRRRAVRKVARNRRQEDSRVRKELLAQAQLSRPAAAGG